MRSLKYAVLALMVLPLVGQAADMTKAKIVTSFSKTAQCIAAVEVNQIDGTEVKVQKAGFEIDPGTHTIQARALINGTLCKAMGVDTGNNPTPPIEYAFEAGKTYYLGYDYNAPLRQDWKLVIWKETPTE